jgi:uncharacterized membrane protein
MDEFLLLIFALFIMAEALSLIALPIIALVVSLRAKKKLAEQISRLEARLAAPAAGRAQPVALSGEPSLPSLIQQLTYRIENLEAALAPDSLPITVARDEAAGAATKPDVDLSAVEARPLVETSPATKPTPAAEPADSQVSLPESAPPLSPEASVRKAQPERIESIIGRRGLGWVAVCLILFGAAFFLKYAFDNRWIGELGRVTIGITAGVSMTIFGYRYHQKRWRVFSQILTAGGIVLLYLSAYAAFGYYHLASQKTAFIYLAILVAEAGLLAFLYNAPAIAIMALLGGFLTPILLHSDRDQYRSLFGYIIALDLGALALLKHWRGLAAVAFAGTHLLFWLWYVDNYHPRKLGAVMVFQTAVFLIFLLAHLGRQLVRAGVPSELRRGSGFEDLSLLLINPFVFFGTAYHLLNGGHHDWMGVFAVGMALVYTATAKLLLVRSATTRSEALTLIGVALTFVTIAIPIQLRQNWITIAWAVEALLLLWAGIETGLARLRGMAYTLFGLVLIRLMFWDTPQGPRGMFIPVVNKYFLSSLIVTGCLFAAAGLLQSLGERKHLHAPALRLALVLIAIGALWFVMSVETHTFFSARATAQKLGADANHEHWLGQMALSVLWSAYAGALAAIGFIRRSANIRWAALVLFTLTVLKAMLIDISQLQQLYRIIVFFVLGGLLLMVAWGYQKAFHARESIK